MGPSLHETWRRSLQTGDEAEVTLSAGRFRGPLIISRSVRIRGAGAGQTVIAAEDEQRALEVAAGVRLELVDLTLLGGRSGLGRGGAFEILDGEVQCARCALLGHRAVFGGAVHVGGEAQLSLDHCRVADNRADKGGGGLAVTDRAQVTLRAVEFAQNRAEDGGHHLYVMGHPDGGPTVRAERVRWSPCSGRGGSIANVRGFEGRFELVQTTWPADSLKVPQRR